MGEAVAKEVRCSLARMPRRVMKYRVMPSLLEKALRQRVMGSASSLPYCWRSEPVY